MDVKLYSAGSLYEGPKPGGTLVVMASDYDALQQQLANVEGENKALREGIERYAKNQVKLVEEAHQRGFAAGCEKAAKVAENIDFLHVYDKISSSIAIAIRALPGGGSE